MAVLFNQSQLPMPSDIRNAKPNLEKYPGLTGRLRLLWDKIRGKEIVIYDLNGSIFSNYTKQELMELKEKMREEKEVEKLRNRMFEDDEEERIYRETGGIRITFGPDGMKIKAFRGFTDEEREELANAPSYL